MTLYRTNQRIMQQFKFFFSVVKKRATMMVRKCLKLFMRLKFFEVIALTSGWNMEQKEDKNVKLSTAVTHVLKSCYNENHQTIVINGDADDIVIKSIKSLETSIILHSSSTEKRSQDKNKVDLFVLSAGDPAEFERILFSVRESPWWNVMTPFFVLSQKNECRNVEIILGILWKLNVLTCYVVCFDSQQREVFYTFNPYSNYAPSQWNLYKEIEKDNSNYMAIYNKIYDRDKICKGFNFDRTKHLDKATITIGCCVPENKAHLLINSTDKSKHYKFSDYELHLISSLKTAFNASMKFEYESDATLKPDGVFNLLGNKTSDFLLCPKSHNRLFGFPGSYTVIYTGFSILSSNLGFRTPLEKIYKFYGPFIIAATIVISIMTYFVIWSVNKRRRLRHSFAAFEMIRLWIASSLYTKIDTLALRCFFSVIFIYFLIIQATFQGHLSKFLTKSELRDNAEVLNDLRSSYYQTIYVTKVTALFLEDDDALKSKSQVTKIPDCIDGVLNGTSAACIMNYLGFLLHFQRRNLSKEVLRNFYLPKTFLRNSYLIFVTRNDWPLKNKFDHILMIMENTGNLLKLNTNLTSSLESSLFYRKIESEFKPIDLKSLLFIFYFLLFGLTSASFCFIIEKFVRIKGN